MDDEVAALVARHTGVIYTTAPVGAGYRADLTAQVRAERGRFFVKAFREDNPDAADPREVPLNPFLRGIGPTLVGYERTTEWMVLVYEHVEGRTSDLSPGSPDVARVVDVVARIGSVVLPDDGPWRHRTWKNVASAQEVALLAGPVLLHSDINPDNVLIGSRVWVVDWSTPTRGAAVVNLGELVTQLIAAGHAPRDAEQAVVGCEAWAGAAPEVLDTLARVLSRMHRRWERQRPGWQERFPAGSWLRAITPAVHAWAAYRGVAEPVEVGGVR
jgi:hypothetical protein